MRSRISRALSRNDLKDKYDNDPHLLEKVTVEDLRNFGMIPEFLGRLPIIFTLNGLDEDMLVKILSEPRNAILKQYQKLLALDEVKLEFDDGALHAIAAKAIQEPEHCVRSWRNTCWISCTKSRRMTVLVK